MQFKQHFKLIYIFVMQYIAFLVIPVQLKSYFFHIFLYLPLIIAYICQNIFYSSQTIKTIALANIHNKRSSIQIILDSVTTSLIVYI